MNRNVTDYRATGQVKIMQVEVAWATRRSAASKSWACASAGTAAALEHRALGPEPAGVDGDRPEELHGEVERRVELAGRQGRVDGAAGGGVEQREITPPCTEPIGL